MVQVAEWINEQGGDWAVGSNWNIGTLPAPQAMVTIDGTGDFIVTVMGSQAAQSLILDDNAATLDVLGALAIGALFTLEAGTALIAGTFSAQTIDVAGTLDILQGTVSASAIALDGGTLLLAGTINDTSITGSSGAQIVTGRATLRDVDDNGTISVQAGATLTLAGTLEDALGSLVNAGVVAISVEVDNSGGIDNTDGTILVGRGGELLLEDGDDTINLSALGRIVNDGGTLIDGEYIDLGGATVSATGLGFTQYLFVEDGTLAVDEAVTLAAIDATVIDTGASFVASGTDTTFIVEGTSYWFRSLENSTIDGLLFSAPGSVVDVSGSLAVYAGTAGGIGTIDATLQFTDSNAELDNAVIGGGSELRVGGPTLTLGQDLLIDGSGTIVGVDFYGRVVNEAVINRGTIEPVGSYEIIGSTFANDGLINATEGTLGITLSTSTLVTHYPLDPTSEENLQHGFANNGVVEVSSLTVLEFDAVVDLVDFGSIDGSDATLIIDPAVSPFDANPGLPPATLDLGGGTLIIGEGETFNELDLEGVLANGTLDVESGGYFVDEGGTLENVVMVTPCFVAGTRIATARGEIAVEALMPGEAVLVRGGGTRPVVWLGHRQVACHRHPHRTLVDPVRVSASAFAPGVPTRDLWLSPDHALHVDGVLMPIKYLLNGCTVAQIAVESIEYWHVELDRHDVLFAEGLEAESYLDSGNRGAFANGGPVAQLHPDLAPDAQAEWMWEAAAYAPLRAEGRVVARIAARLRRRARALGLRPAPRRRPRSVPEGGTEIASVDLLHESWYLAANPDVAASGLTARAHYAGWGRREGRPPCPEGALLRGLGLIDPGTVAVTMADVLLAGADPVRHFCRLGWRERRRPNPYFDTGWYLDTHRVPPGMNPLLHYVLFGEAQGLPPSRHFDPAWYCSRHHLAPDVSPLAHYLRYRRAQSLSPLPSFDVAAHVRNVVGFLRVGRDPYAHFRTNAGAMQRRAAA